MIKRMPGGERTNHQPHLQAQRVQRQRRRHPDSAACAGARTEPQRRGAGAAPLVVGQVAQAAVHAIDQHHTQEHISRKPARGGVGRGAEKCCAEQQQGAPAGRLHRVGQQGPGAALAVDVVQRHRDEGDGQPAESRGTGAGRPGQHQRQRHLQPGDEQRVRAAQFATHQRRVGAQRLAAVEPQVDHVVQHVGKDMEGQRDSQQPGCLHCIPGRGHAGRTHQRQQPGEAESRDADGEVHAHDPAAPARRQRGLAARQVSGPHRVPRLLQLRSRPAGRSSTRAPSRWPWQRSPR